MQPLVFFFCRACELVFVLLKGDSSSFAWFSHGDAAKPLRDDSRLGRRITGSGRFSDVACVQALVNNKLFSDI